MPNPYFRFVQAIIGLLLVYLALRWCDEHFRIIVENRLRVLIDKSLSLNR